MPSTDQIRRPPRAPFRRVPRPLLDTIAGGARRYQRWRHLPRLVRVEFSELDDFSQDPTRAIVGRLTTAVARERRRALAGHWSYDINRHIALLQAVRAEMRILRDAVCAEKRRQERRSRGQASAATVSAAAAASDILTALLTGTKAS